VSDADQQCEFDLTTHVGLWKLLHLRILLQHFEICCVSIASLISGLTEAPDLGMSLYRKPSSFLPSTAK
jgi:hypothetical protein